MMNLTTVSAFIKKAGKYLILIAFVYYSWILVLAPSGKALIKAIFFKETPPNPIYGVLNPLEFTEKNIDKKNIQYELNTESGRLPDNFPKKMNVYEFKPQQYSYLAGKNAQADAQILGFTDEDLITDLKGNVFQWRNSGLDSMLTIEINTRQIFQETNLAGKSMYFIPGDINTELAKQIGADLFGSLSRFDDLYSQGYVITKLGGFLGNKIYETKDIREGQIVLVDFYRVIEGVPVLGPDPGKGLLRALITSASKEPNPLNYPMVEASYWGLDGVTKASYPIISVKNAWNAILEGKGVIANVTPKNANPFENSAPANVERVLIDNIFLAYYETPKYQKYLQPIYVFQGTYTIRGAEGGYIQIYFPAITAEYTESSSK